MEFEIGSTLGDYQMVGTLGEGGMGKVYKVRNVISDRIEAMKVLLPDLASTPELADRFLREIKVLAALDHPNIAQLHTAVRVDKQLLMVMEFVDGETLDHRLRQGRLPLAQVLDYIAQILSALEFAHSRGVVHRDIKPANMMLTQAGVVKLMDFGIARAAVDQKLTMTGTTVGSVYYMSPEQIQGAATLDARADLYSVGVTLYELATGKRPFDGESQYAIMAAHLEKTPVPPIEVDPRLPQALNEVILISVAKDPASRFQSAAAFRNALVSVAAELKAPTISAPVVAPVPSGSAPPAKGKRWLWVSVGGVAATAAIVCVVEFAPWKTTHAAAPRPQISAVQTPPPSSPPAVEEPAPNKSEPVEAPVAVSVPVAAAVPSEKLAAPLKEHAQPKMPAKVNSPALPPVAPPPVPQQATAAPAPVSAAPGRAEALQLREHLDKLQVRAGSIQESLANLRSSMQAQGLSLSGKFTQPQGLMDTYLRSANEALNRGDAPAARTYADKAEHQIEALESLLNL